MKKVDGGKQNYKIQSSEVYFGTTFGGVGSYNRLLHDKACMGMQCVSNAGTCRGGSRISRRGGCLPRWGGGGGRGAQASDAGVF